MCSQILSKGTKVFVSGRIQSKEAVSFQGERLRKTEIVASDIIALDKRKDTRVTVPAA
ncbi:single-stranded DNA-binding protein [Candidatus Microgenomates bacterium]|nr:single-stranded DNA-binding protein [Candidatus Microgenomates bacterium]